jgi:hypothetical protein
MTTHDPVSSSSPLLHLQYTPLASPKHIRLLRIAPSTSTSDHIEVSLEEVEINAGIPYECLSYTWDDPKFRPSSSDAGEYWNTSHKRIICNGAVTYIRQNLHDALVQLRSSGSLGPIWIDALCINQDDVSERNTEVGRMGIIYERASQVVVWLGEEDEYTKPTIELLKRFNLAFKDFVRQKNLGTYEFQRCNYNPDETGIIHCFFVQRTWFSRLWVIQETLHARHLRFLCGPHNLLLETMQRGILVLYLNPITPPEHKFWMNIETQNFYDVIISRNNWLQSMVPDPIGYNLHVYRSFRSSDPRDKVFGLLGISGQ